MPNERKREIWALAATGKRPDSDERQRIQQIQEYIDKYKNLGVLGDHASNVQVHTEFYLLDSGVTKRVPQNPHGVLTAIENTSCVVTLFIEAVDDAQKLANVLAECEARIAELEDRNAVQEARIAELEAQLIAARAESPTQVVAPTEFSERQEKVAEMVLGA
jgi:hypothetical protein